jgi:hypothetical protein
VRKDRRGIEGLPLRLMLVALLISLTLPTMLSFLKGTSSSIAEDKAAEIAGGIVGTMEEMAAGGPGNVRTVKVPGDLPSGIIFRIGGNSTMDRTRVIWSVDGRENVWYLAGVTVVTENDWTLTLSAGDSLRLECPPGTWGTVKAVIA